MNSDWQRVIRHWVVCETGDRWRRCVWRFVPEWLAEDETLQVRQAHSSDVAAEMERIRFGVVLWEVDGARLDEVSRNLAASDANRPAWLQIVAADRMAHADRCALTQFGVNAFIRHPEDLAALRPLVTGHFARAARVLH